MSDYTFEHGTKFVDRKEEKIRELILAGDRLAYVAQHNSGGLMREVAITNWQNAVEDLRKLEEPKP